MQGKQRIDARKEYEEDVRLGVRAAIEAKDIFFNNLFFEEKVVLGCVDKLEETIDNLIIDEAKKINEENLRRAAQSLASKLGQNEW